MVGYRIEMREAEMTGRHVELAVCGRPIQSSSARFRVGGIGRGQGIVLLYPDKLAAVNSYTERIGGGVLDRAVDEQAALPALGAEQVLDQAVEVGADLRDRG